jgi:hypothetical protein
MRKLLTTVAPLAAVLLVAGCNKTPKAPPPPQVNGVTVDLPQLQAAMATNQNATVQEEFNNFSFGFRYGDYVKSLMALDKLANDPAVTPQQKTVITQVMEQIKQVANSAPAKPAQ